MIIGSKSYGTCCGSEKVQNCLIISGILFCKIKYVKKSNARIIMGIFLLTASLPRAVRIISWDPKQYKYTICFLTDKNTPGLQKKIKHISGDTTGLKAKANPWFTGAKKQMTLVHSKVLCLTAMYFIPAHKTTFHFLY